MHQKAQLKGSFVASDLLFSFHFSFHFYFLLYFLLSSLLVLFVLILLAQPCSPGLDLSCIRFCEKHVSQQIKSSRLRHRRRRAMLSPYSLNFPGLKVCRKRAILSPYSRTFLPPRLCRRRALQSPFRLRSSRSFSLTSLRSLWSHSV